MVRLRGVGDLPICRSEHLAKNFAADARNAGRKNCLGAKQEPAGQRTAAQAIRKNALSVGPLNLRN